MSRDENWAPNPCQKILKGSMEEKNESVGKKLKMLECSEKGCNIQREAVVKLVRLSEDTISRILGSCNSNLPQTTKKSASPRSLSEKHLLCEMEKRLSVWVIQQAKVNSGRVPKNKVKRKAKQIFKRLKALAGDRYEDAKFSGSKKWFDKYKKRSGWLNKSNPICHVSHSKHCTCRAKHRNSSAQLVPVNNVSVCPAESTSQNRKDLILKKIRELEIDTFNLDTYNQEWCFREINFHQRDAAQNTSSETEGSSKSRCDTPPFSDVNSGTIELVSSEEEEDLTVFNKQLQKILDKTLGISTNNLTLNNGPRSRRVLTEQDKQAECVPVLVTSAACQPDRKNSTFTPDGDDICASNKNPSGQEIQLFTPSLHVNSESPIAEPNSTSTFLSKEYSPSVPSGSGLCTVIENSHRRVSRTLEFSTLSRLSSPSPNCGNSSVWRFRRKLVKIIKQENYTPQQIFNVHETVLFWKKLPQNCGIEDDTPESKDPMMLLLGANASGDCKFEPMLVYSKENPPPIRHVIKSSLPVLWKFHPRAKITTSLFEDWFTYSFVPTVQVYCMEKQSPFKVLLLLDNASCHSRMLEYAHPNVKVIFLPPDAAPLLQPMDQGITESFKACYLKRVFELIVENVERENGVTLQSFWKSFNILNAMKIINTAWNDVVPSNITSAWMIVSSKTMPKDVNIVTQCIINLSSQLQLDLAEHDIKMWMDYHSQELTEEELQNLEKQSTDVVEEQMPLATFAPEKLSEAFKCLETAMEIFESEDPNFKRSSIVNESIKNSYLCYREICTAQKETFLHANRYLSSMDVENDPFESDTDVIPNLDKKPSPSRLRIWVQSNNVDSSQMYKLP